MLSLSRARALSVVGITALGLGAAGSLVEAPASLAAAPSTGTACQTDGKINARGSTLQTWLQQDLIGKYASDVCGPVGSPSTTSPSLQDTNHLYYQAGGGVAASSFAAVDPTDPLTASGGAADATAVPNSSGTTEPYYGGDWMIAYNPYAAANYGQTGSTYGRIAMSCRTDAFAGTDIPYTASQYVAINGVPGASASTAANGKGCVQTFNASDSPKAPTDANLLQGTALAPTNAWNPAFEATPSGGWPNTSDPQGTSSALSGNTDALMSFPIGESAVDFPINLQTGTNGTGQAEYCGTTSTVKPAVKLSVADILGLMGGVIQNWEQLDGQSGWGGSATYTVNGVTYSDTGENASLASCNLTVQRVVRADDSGTTQAVVNFLNDASGSTGPGTGAPGGGSTVATCVPSSTANIGTFGDLDSDIVGAGHNNLWPGEGGAENAPTQGTTAGCTEVTPGGFTGVAGNTGVSGGPALLTTLETSSGGIGYADVSDELNVAGTSILTTPTIETQTSTALSSGLGYASTGVSYASPRSGATASNCNGSVVMPGTSGQDVGTSGEWALDVGQSGTFNPQNSDDIAWTGEPSGKYPACTLTWDYVWGNDHAANGASPDPESELNNDQRRTIYSYFTYLFSSAAQSSLGGAGYASLPQTDLDTLRQGFQTNF